MQQLCIETMVQDSFELKLSHKFKFVQRKKRIKSITILIPENSS